LQKALFPSPAAALESTQKRIALLQAKPSATEDEATEVDGLQVLSKALKAITQDSTAAPFSKYQRLLEQLRSPAFGWGQNNASDRLVIGHREVRQALLPRWVFLGEVDLALRPELSAPQAHAAP
jgi:hypothetical protein